MKENILKSVIKNRNKKITREHQYSIQKIQN